jgi:hypothetical protein
MKKYPSFKIDFLGCEITVIFDKNWRDITRKILKRPLELTGNAVALDMDRDYYILASPNVKYPVICHECMHILIWIAAAYSLSFELDNQETMAYLIEYLIDETIKIKKRKR